MLPDPLQGAALPLGVALGGVDDQHIHTGLHQSGHPLSIVPGVDAGAHHIALVGIQQLVDVLFMAVIVLAEHDVFQPALAVHQGQGVDLVVPNDVVGLFQGGGVRGDDQLLQGGHKLLDLDVGAHPADPVVPAGHDAHQHAVGGAVLGNGHSGVAGLGLQGQHVGQGGLRGQVGVGGDKALLIVLDPGDHGRLVLNALRAIDKGDAALLGQGDGQLLPGDRLHHRADHGDIHGQGALLLALPVLDQRGLEADGVGHILRGGIAGDQQILTEGAGGFRIVIRHKIFSFFRIYIDCCPIS